MSFPFPKNPTDGQVVSSTAPDGTILTATYHAGKNEWELTRQQPSPPPIASGAPPAPVVVNATADGQVITWDQVAGRWVAKTPSTAATGTTKSFVKAQQADADQANGVGPAQLKPGDVQFTAENLHHEIKFWNGAAWLESLSEDTIKQWISAGSLFRGVVKESSLSTLPTPAVANRGYYYSWTGAPGYVVQAADPGIGTSLAGEVLQVGDWIQSDGTKWVHVPGDLLSKQRWDSLGSFAPWSDTSWEKGSVVSYQQGFWRANALISPGDDPPEVAPGNKWTDITPHPSIKLAELADVNDNVALQGEDGVLIWSEVDQEFVVSRTFNIDAIEFDTTGPGVAIEGLFQGDISLGKNLDSQVPSVEAVARYVDSRSLEDLAGSTDLNTAQDGEFIAYDAANNKWVPKAASSSIAGLTDVDLTTTPPTDSQVLAWNATSRRWVPKSTSSPILFIGSGALVAANIAVAGSNYGMPADTVPPPASYPPAPGDQYLDLMTGVVTAFTGTVVGTPRAGTITGVTSPATKDLIPEALDKLLDVTITSPADKQILQYDNAASQWKNVTPDYLNPTNGYTKTDIDNKLNSAVLGLEHEAAVLSRTDIPPASPILGDTHIVGVTPTGIWVGQNNFLARWDGTTWQFSAPRVNESHLIEDVGETWHWNGTNWVKVAVAQAAATSTGELWQVGSIQQSMLSETQWASVIGPEAAKWVLCDGRNVAGSRYATVTGQTTVPDLRGAFIRGAGQNSNAAANWNGGAVGSTHQDTTRAPRNTAFSGTTSASGDHQHYQTVGAFSGGSTGVRTWSGATPGGGGELTFGAGNHTHTVTMGGGDSETAPVHVSLNYFCKIN